MASGHCKLAHGDFIKGSRKPAGGGATNTSKLHDLVDPNQGALNPLRMVHCWRGASGSLCGHHVRSGSLVLTFLAEAGCATVVVVE